MNTEELGLWVGGTEGRVGSGFLSRAPGLYLLRSFTRSFTHPLEGGIRLSLPLTEDN